MGKYKELLLKEVRTLKQFQSFGQEGTNKQAELARAAVTARENVHNFEVKAADIIELDIEDLISHTRQIEEYVA